MGKLLREFQYIGSAGKFVAGECYTIKQIRESTGLTDNVIRCRVQYGNKFDDDMLRPRDYRPPTIKKKSPAQKNQRASIIKNAVISETQYLTQDDPVALAKVKNWLKVAIQKPVDFWLAIDSLLLSQIIKIAVNYKDESR